MPSDDFEYLGKTVESRQGYWYEVHESDRDDGELQLVPVDTVPGQYVTVDELEARMASGWELVYDGTTEPLRTDGGSTSRKVRDAERFWSWYDIPIEFGTAIKVRKSGLSRGSWGDGRARDTVVHLHVKEGFTDGRLSRTADSYLCEPGSYISSDAEETSLRDGLEQKVTCETCLARMERWKLSVFEKTEQEEDGDPVTDGGITTGIGRVMVDIETLGIEPGSAILSIGAVTFSEDGLGDEFYREISLESCQEAGLQIDADTLEWWLSQDDAVAEVLTGGESLTHVLGAFGSWYRERAFDEVWANSPSFDCEHLETAFDAIGMTEPWEFRDERDVRTLRSLPCAAKVEMDGDEHNALDDAKYQARIVSETLRSLQQSTDNSDDDIVTDGGSTVDRYNLPNSVDGLREVLAEIDAKQEANSREREQYRESKGVVDEATELLKEASKDETFNDSVRAKLDLLASVLNLIVYQELSHIEHGLWYDRRRLKEEQYNVERKLQRLEAEEAES